MITALFGLPAGATAVVVLIEHVGTRVQPIGDDPPVDPVSEQCVAQSGRASRGEPRDRSSGARFRRLAGIGIAVVDLKRARRPQGVSLFPARSVAGGRPASSGTDGPASSRGRGTSRSKSTPNRLENESALPRL